MGSMMKSMTIGPKFILSISMAAFVAIAIGLFVLYQQEEDKMDTMLVMELLSSHKKKNHQDES